MFSAHGCSTKGLGGFPEADFKSPRNLRHNGEHNFSRISTPLDFAGKDIVHGSPRQLESQPPAWLLGRRDSLPEGVYFLPTKSSLSTNLSKPQPRRVFDARVDAFCEAKPLFRQGPGGTFIMELSGVNVQMTTSCNPHPSIVGSAGGHFFRPRSDFFLRLPEVEYVLFDPASEKLSRSTSAHKSMIVLEVSDQHDLSAKISTNSPSGSITLEDVLYKGSVREAAAQTTLNYELRANGKISILRRHDVHELHIEFNFDFQCWLSGSVLRFDHPHKLADHHEVGCTAPLDQDRAPLADESPRSYYRRTKAPSSQGSLASAEEERSEPGSRLRDQLRLEIASLLAAAEEVAAEELELGEAEEAQEAPEAMNRTPRATSRRLSHTSENVMRALGSTNDELVQIENRVQSISLMVPEASTCELNSLKSELSQIEAKAKQLETKGIDDVYTGGLHSGKQMAKEAKKDMLTRFESLFGNIDEAFAKVKSRLP